MRESFQGVAARLKRRPYHGDDVPASRLAPAFCTLQEHSTRCPPNPVVVTEQQAPQRNTHGSPPPFADTCHIRHVRLAQTLVLQPSRRRPAQESQSTVAYAYPSHRRNVLLFLTPHLHRSGHGGRGTTLMRLCDALRERRAWDGDRGGRYRGLTELHLHRVAQPPPRENGLQLGGPQNDEAGEPQRTGAEEHSCGRRPERPPAGVREPTAKAYGGC